MPQFDRVGRQLCDILYVPWQLYICDGPALPIKIKAFNVILSLSAVAGKSN